MSFFIVVKLIMLSETCTRVFVLSVLNSYM